MSVISLDVAKEIVQAIENELGEGWQPKYRTLRESLSYLKQSIKSAESATVEKPRVLIAVVDGAVEPYFNPNEVDVHHVGIDTDEPEDNYGTQLPERFRGLATEAGILDDVTFE